MPDPEEHPAGPLSQKSVFKPVDSDQFQIGTLNKPTADQLDGWHRFRGQDYAQR